jgi:TRAP-type C4-dicarboxylate transport system permease small subunit
MFIWTTLFGACYAMRDETHVRFTLIYDNSAPKVKFWMRIIGNLILLISFIIAFIPTYNWVNFMSFKKSNVLKVPMNIVFFPYIIFMIIMMGRIAYNLYIDIRKLPRGKT